MAFRADIAGLGVITPYDGTIAAAAGGDASFIALIKGVIAAESGWRPDAVNPTDPSYGLMQIMLPTARIYQPGVTVDDLLNPHTNIMIGAAFLRELLRTRSPNDAVAYYNAGCPTPKVAGLSGCPLRNSSGQYVNSLGSTAVQAYVDSVITYQVFYINAIPATVIPYESPVFQNGTPVTTEPEPLAGGEGEAAPATEFAFMGESLGGLLEGAGAVAVVGLLVAAALLWPRRHAWTL